MERERFQVGYDIGGSSCIYPSWWYGTMEEAREKVDSLIRKLSGESSRVSDSECLCVNTSTLCYAISDTCGAPAGNYGNTAVVTLTDWESGGKSWMK